MRLINADEIVYESIDSTDTTRHECYYGTGILAVRKEDIDAMPTVEPERTYKRGYADGYHRAEKDYFERTEKDRADAFKAGVERKNGRTAKRMDEMTFTLHNPLTEEELDIIEDVDFDNTNSITFHTKHGKEVVFVKRKRGRWLELTNTNHTYVCSVCGRMLVNITDGKNTVTKNYPFCHCGADMRGGESECVME